jgi:hypothetical protein
MEPGRGSRVTTTAFGMEAGAVKKRDDGVRSRRCSNTHCKHTGSTYSSLVGYCSACLAAAAPPTIHVRWDCLNEEA